MVINEKTLVSQMKEAYKKGGYVVANRKGESYIIQTSFWAVEIDSENLPREALSLMALHMGFLPGEDRAYRITKTKEGPSVQDLMISVALGNIGEIENEINAAASVPVMARKTIVTYDGCSVWQKEGNCGVILIDPRYESILRKKQEARIVSDALYAEGEISKVYIMRVNKNPDEPEIVHLSNTKWTVVK